MNQIRKRLTYANVMSSIAVFLVLGGAAFAASQLPKNSVGSKQLKKNAVTAAKIKKNAITTAKIKKDAVTGTQVNEATLGTVPSANSASTAGTASVANSLSSLEATHLVGAPGEPGFENGAHNFPLEGASVKLNPVGFYKDHEGIVHLQGVARFPEMAEGGIFSVFTLPPGFRPAPGTLVLQEQITGAAAVIGGSNTVLTSEGSPSIDLSGKVAGSGSATEEKSVALEGITFRAES